MSHTELAMLMIFLGLLVLVYRHFSRRVEQLRETNDLQASQLEERQRRIAELTHECRAAESHWQKVSSALLRAEAENNLWRKRYPSQHEMDQVQLRMMPNSPRQPQRKPL